MKANMGKIAMLVVMAALFAGQPLVGIGASAQSKLQALQQLQQQSQANTTARASDLPFTFTAIQDEAPATLQTNARGAEPGYLVRFISQTLTLPGVDRTSDFYYNVPRATLGPNNYVELSIRYSELLRPDASSLTVSIDNKPLTSVMPARGTQGHDMLRIPLGEEETRLGYHKITIAKHSRLTDNPCDDEANPANWVKIDNSSHVFLDTQGSTTVSDPLKEFPYPFIEAGTPAESHGHIVVPNNPSSAVLSAALQLAASLSAAVPTHPTVPIMTESEWVASETPRLQHTIALGAEGSWSPALRQAWELSKNYKNKPLTRDEAAFDTYTMTDPSSQVSKLLLLVRGADDQSVSGNIRLLTDHVLSKQLSGKQLRVMDMHEPQTNPVSMEQTAAATPIPVTLAAAGYEHILLNKAKQEITHLALRVPTHWKITGKSTLDLLVKVSPLLLQEQADEGNAASEAGSTAPSGLTVTINGIPTTFSAQELVKTMSDNGTASVSLPIDEHLQAGNRALDVSLAAHLGGRTHACTERESVGTNDGRWIFVNKESGLTIPHELASGATFANWPAPFVNDHGFEQTAFLVPREMKNGYLTQLSMLTTTITARTNKQGAPVVFREPLQAEERQKLALYHIIVTGPLQDYPSLQSEEAKLLLPANDPLAKLRGFDVVRETAENIAWIQTSPWRGDKCMVVFQAGHTSSASHAAGAFLHPDILTHLDQNPQDGQLVIRSKSGEVFTIKTGGEQERANGTQSSATLTDLPLWLLVLLPAVFIAALLIFIRLLRKEKKKS